MPQEFLASFAVDIDEGGVTRLQTILSQNRDMASQLASAFDTARSSMMAFIQAASTELAALPFFSGSPEEALGAPGAFSIDLDFSRATAQLNSFLAAAKKQMKLNADWADIFDKATWETQHMIIAGLVERVDVGNGYDIQIKLRISATQFFNPDMEPAGIEQAS